MRRRNEIEPTSLSVLQRISRSIALHEGAHACVAISIGIPVAEIRLLDTLDESGRMRPKVNAGSLPVGQYLLYALAGHEAECLEWPMRRFTEISRHDLSDLAHARLALARELDVGFSGPLRGSSRSRGSQGMKSPA
jgi:hypothetical protein